MEDSKINFDFLKKGTWEEAWNLGFVLHEHKNIKLVPVGSWIIQQEELISAFADWRWNARDMFFARFPRSAESMRNYLINTSIKQSDVILFAICEDDKTPYGHIGLTHASFESAEIDSVMRSITKHMPGLMRTALGTLEIFAHQKYGIGELKLKVISTNDRALKLYENSGYSVRSSVALNLQVEGDYIQHIEATEESSNVDYRSIEMFKTLNETTL